MLSYGVNYNEYKEQPEAFRKQVQTSRGFPSLTTVISGIVADAQHKPFELGVRVSSYATGAGPYKLTYVLTVFGKSGVFRILETTAKPLEVIS